jgi:hypothetical protein
MSKKKLGVVVIDARDGISADEASQAGQVLRQRQDADEVGSEYQELPFRVGQWHGLPNFRCPLCPFETLDLTGMQDHINQHKGTP